MTHQAIHFKKLNEFFDKIYVITLERATERQTKIKQTLAGLNYEFFNGADNKNFSKQDLQAKGIYDEAKAKAVHRYNKPMQSGMIGCTWSHRMVYENILENNYIRVLILEDDIEPNEDGLLVFENIIDELPADWELVYFDYNKHTTSGIFTSIKQKFYHVQKLFGGLVWTHTTINNLYAKPFSTHLKTAGYHDYTSAYAITNTATAKLLKLQTPIAFIADHLLAYAATNKMISAFIAIPKLFEQESQKNKTATGSYAEEI